MPSSALGPACHKSEHWTTARRSVGTACRPSVRPRSLRKAGRRQSCKQLSRRHALEPAPPRPPSLQRNMQRTSSQLQQPRLLERSGRGQNSAVSGRRRQRHQQLSSSCL